jgi:hypothetical protein
MYFGNGHVGRFPVLPGVTYPTRLNASVNTYAFPNAVGRYAENSHF